MRLTPRDNNLSDCAEIYFFFVCCALSGTWKVERKREMITCQGPDANAEDIVSTKYLEALRRLNAVLIVTPEITRTQWTETISGGRQMSWGMSLNKMAVSRSTRPSLFNVFAYY